ncbi:MAG: polymer-forming cytoskeletal protein [Polaribacter sp.]|uniref:bactofilin family protein n=1 Tax=Polaribacter sp. TaxID=1920175 RepID=UPI003BB10B62
MERNVIGKNTKIIGDIISEGDFRIDGVLEGTLKTKGRVIIGVDGSVKGDVEALNADIEGKISGKLQVEKTLIVKGIASISGEVITGKLSIEPGADFNASCEMRIVKKDPKVKDEKKLEQKQISHQKAIKKTFK